VLVAHLGDVDTGMSAWAAGELALGKVTRVGGIGGAAGQSFIRAVMTLTLTRAGEKKRNAGPVTTRKLRVSASSSRRTIFLIRPIRTILFPITLPRPDNTG